MMQFMRAWVILAVLILTAATRVVLGGDPGAKGNPLQRPVQDDSKWERLGDLLWNFRNMYQPCVVEIPGQEYRYRMWFFGWAAVDCNRGYPGCDAIFHARSKDLKTWEVYAGANDWDRQMKPCRWVPVIAADNRPYDAWHNGDPSVVFREGRYYMAFSSTGRPGTPEGHPLDLLMCIMGATSEDGIHWQKTRQPLLIEPPEAQAAKSMKGWTGAYHRPSLLWDQGKWRLWFDYWRPTGGICMGYAENTGEFAAASGFHLLRAGGDPLIADWPNPEVVKIGNRYHCFADPPGYPGKRQNPNVLWTSRQLCEAVSDDGLRWTMVGFLPPDPDAPACHVPQALVTTLNGQAWLYLFYATQRGGDRPYDYRYDRIRAMRRKL